jgi:hypothetical protein
MLRGGLYERRLLSELTANSANDYLWTMFECVSMTTEMDAPAESLLQA